LNSSAGSINLIVPVGNPPVAITAAANANSPATAANLTTGAPPLFSPGDTVNVQVNGLDPAVASNLARVQVTVSGLSMPVTQAGGGQVQFVLTQSFGGSPVPVVVLVDGSPSAAFTVAVR
ncbi:MAG TPA: hypothetical protein VGS58_17715, partial [Candidatus Sulfopaludibacter sp.]|nr:hypothetical protein [Candidatus Sulfopaludibacter sp.]